MPQKTALIAGASRGLGLGLATELLARGWRVIATARDPARAAGLAALAKAHPGALAVETLDIDDAAGVATLAGRLRDARLDLLFVNAGVMDDNDLAGLTPAAFAAIMRTNALSPVALANALESRVPADGTVAFMTSRMGSVAEMTAGNAPAYRASKAALNAMTRCWVAGLGGRRTVLNVHPGWVRTDMGGANAAVAVEDSVRGIADVVERLAGRGGQHYVDYQGNTIPW
jgi:NAD(P)-dependent dehydrogenase (short-subunit alcohol dehydrogenase family)